MFVFAVLVVIRRKANDRGGVAVSTAGRLSRLRKEDILDVSRISAVVVDSSFLDDKKQSIWDLDDTVPILKVLTHEHEVPIYLY
jgi:hypothetical protein